MSEEIHVKPDAARAGETPHIVRYVLAISLILAALLMAMVFLWGANWS